MIKRIPFRLSTLLLCTVSIAAGFAAWIKRHDWYVTKTIATGFEQNCGVAAFEDQDRLICFLTDIPHKFVVRRLSTGEVLHESNEFDYAYWHLTSGDQGQLYGHGAYEIVEIDPVAEIDSRRNPVERYFASASSPGRRELITAVSPNGKYVLGAGENWAAIPPEDRSKRSDVPVIYRMRDVNTNDLLWERHASETTLALGAFTKDSRRVAISIDGKVQVFDVASGELVFGTRLELTSRASDDSQVEYIRPPKMFDDGRRLFAGDCIYDLARGKRLARLDPGSHFATIVHDTFLIATHDGRLRYWRRLRPEGNWSPLHFPELWIAVVLATLCAADVWRNSRVRPDHEPNQSHRKLSGN